MMQNVLETQNSAERIKQLVEKEGKAARNLVTWSVPITDSENAKLHLKQAGARGHSNSRNNTANRREKSRKRGKNNSTHTTLPPLAGQVKGHDSQVSLSEREKICNYYSSKTQRHLRSSKSPSKHDLHARYWSYLFDNLHRAVDEIYKTCDVDESVVECQEVIMTLEVCRKDFGALIQRIQLFKQSDLHTKSSNLAWEVRKTISPGKPRVLTSRAIPSPPPTSSLPPHQASQKVPQHQPAPITTTTTTTTTASSTSVKLASKKTNKKIPDLQDNKQNIPPSSARSLDFGNPASLKAKGRNSSKKSSSSSNDEVRNGEGMPTWADKVKGVLRPASSTGVTRGHHHHPLKKEEKAIEDGVLKKELASDESLVEDGWEMVTRGRARSANSGMYKPTQQHRQKEEFAASKSSQSDCVFQQNDRTHTDKEKTDARKNRKEPESKREKEMMCLKEILSSTKWEPKYEHEDSSSYLGYSLEELKSWSKGTPDEDVVMEMVQEWMNGRANVGPAKGEEREKEEDAGGNGDSDVSVFQEGGADLRGKQRSLQSEGSLPNVSEGELEGELSKRNKENKGIEEKDILTWNDALEVYNANEAYRTEMSWADRCDSPPEGFSDTPRSPGRAIHLHQRLSSPSRKRQVELEETRRIQEEKQAKAQLQRSKVQEEKTLKSRVEADKIREARESRDALARQRKEALEDKLQRAEILRESHLQERIRRAQEEEAKVSEISFINTLEAQNRKIEVLERYQGREARLQELLDERQKRRDEQLAKEEAAQERRKTIEAERLAKLMEMEQKRKDQEAKVEQMMLEKERIREEAVKEKAKERERKMTARNTALQTSTEELGRKILLKQNESSKRYDQQIEQKKKLATGAISSRHTSAELPPRVEAYTTKKWCTACNVEIISEVYLLSHLRGRKHQASLALLPPTSLSEGGAGEEEGEEENPMIIDAPEEHQGPNGELPEVQERMHAGKKRAKKLRQRMNTRAKEIENRPGAIHSHSKNRAKFQKALRELNKQVDSAATGLQLNLTSSQVPLIDRALGDILRALVSRDDQLCFSQLGGVASVLKMLMLSVGDSNGKLCLPEKTFFLGVNVLLSSCAGQPENCLYLITSNKAIPLIDLSLIVLTKALSDRTLRLRQYLKSSKEVVVGVGVKPGDDAPVCGLLLRLVASMVSTLASGSLGEKNTPVMQQVTDAISYMVSVGLVDKLGEYFGSIYGPIEQLSTTQLVLGGLNLLVATTAFLHSRVVDVFSGKSCDDPTLLTTLLKQTELIGLMQLLYAILLSDGPPRHSHSPPPLTDHTLYVALATIKALNNSAILDLKMVQTCLGAEGISLEFRHIVSCLLWYCSHNECTNLLHELILAVGYFCVLNHDNQVYLQSGRSPTLLQLLCGLPFEYFSNPRLSQLLYPTLISACYQMEENRAILEEEISSKLLVAFLREPSLRDSDKKEETSKGERIHKATGSPDLSSMLCHRFPRDHWENAIRFFSQSPSQ